MENKSLYSLPYPRYLPVLEEPDQQVVWSKSRFEEGIILLRLRDFDLAKENLRPMQTMPSTLGADMASAAAPVDTPGAKGWTKYNELWGQTKEEFEETGKIEGSLFLTPDLQKIWLSRYEIGYLKKIS